MWGPLHYYLLGGALAVVPDQLIAPILLNVLLATGTAILLYAFTCIEFSQAGATFVALAYGLSPLVVRHSLMAVSETPFTFFVAGSLVLAALARKSDSCSYAALSGGSLTLAGALRYEAWVLIPFFYAVISWPGSVGRAHRTLTMLVAGLSRRSLCFLASSLVFPVFWMVGNWAHSGDPLYGINAARSWQLDVLSINEHLTLPRLVERVVFFPSMVLLGPTPVISTFALLGLCLATGRERARALWLLPFGGLLGVLIVQAVTGGVLLKGRYSLVLVMMLFPFASLLFDVFEGKARTLLPVLTVVIALPFVIFTQVSWWWFEEANPIPRLQTSERLEVDSVSRLVERSGPGGLLLEAWDRMLHLAIMAGRKPDQVFLVHGTRRHAVFDCDRLIQFLSRRPSGSVVVRRESSWIQFKSPHELTFGGCPVDLEVVNVAEVESAVVISYREK